MPRGLVMESEGKALQRQRTMCVCVCLCVYVCVPRIELAHNYVVKF